VQDAVESLGGRVTVGDVSARAGVKISEAEEALNALAADASGTLEVSPCWTAMIQCVIQQLSPCCMLCLAAVGQWLLTLRAFSYFC